MSIGNDGPLRTIVLDRFRVAFGEPDRVIGDDHHWSLRPLSYVAAVNILVNGGKAQPIVWVFDPHDPSNGVHHRFIRSEEEIGPIIDGISQRVREAGRPRKNP